MDNWIKEGSRKSNYWRGFKVAILVVAIVELPLVIGLAIYLNHVLAALS